MARDPYFERPEVSNSDLTWLKNQLFPRDMPDPTQAYRFGSLIDAMLTENDKVDYYRRTLEGYQYTTEDFAKAVMMKESFMRDEFCRDIITGSDPQKIMIRRMEMNYNGLDFALQTRCKWDIWRATWGGDIKSTTAETQQQFQAACEYFDYDRQRAWYMDIAGSDKDVIIGISKKNLRIFKVFINRESTFYKNGREKYLTLALKWWTMFGEAKPVKPTPPPPPREPEPEPIESLSEFMQQHGYDNGKINMGYMNGWDDQCSQQYKRLNRYATATQENKKGRSCYEYKSTIVVGHETAILTYAVDSGD